VRTGAVRGWWWRRRSAPIVTRDRVSRQARLGLRSADGGFAGETGAMPTTSAGLLLYRTTDDGALEVLLGHMGGPFWARKDAGAWTVLKGELDPDEEPHAAALREAAEELGLPLPAPSTPDLDLGEVRQKSGK